MTLTIRVRQVYGKDMIYPECDKARAFLKALGLATFTPSAVAAAKALGYSFNHATVGANL